MNIWAGIALVALAVLIPIAALLIGVASDEPNLGWVGLLGVSVTLADFIFLLI